MAGGTRKGMCQGYRTIHHTLVGALSSTAPSLWCIESVSRSFLEKVPCTTIRRAKKARIGQGWRRRRRGGIADTLATRLLAGQSSRNRIIIFNLFCTSFRVFLPLSTFNNSSRLHLYFRGRRVMSEPPPPDDGDSIAVEIIPITSGSGGEFAEAIQALIAGFQKAHVPTTLLDSLREVEKLPTLHTDPHEQDFMRRYFTQWDRFYKFREHARMKGQNRQVVSRRANTIRRLRDIVANHEKMASDDDEDDGEVDDNVDGAPAEAPAAVVEWRPTAPKHFRPKGTPAPAQPLQETDFAKQSYHVAMSEMAFSIYHVAGFASDKPYQLGWPSNLVDIVLDVSAYFGRRLTTLLRPNKVLTKELCNQVCAQQASIVTTSLASFFDFSGVR